MVENISDETLKKVQAVALVALLASGAFAVSSFIGCASAPAIPAMQQLDEIIKSGLLSPSHTINAAEKKQIKSAIIAGAKQLKEDEKKIKELSFWEKWGKLGVACIALSLILSLIFRAIF